MVLVTFADYRTEQELSTILDSFGFGTPAFHVHKLKKLGYNIEYRPFALEDLILCITQGLFPIVFVDAGMLPWTDFEGFHALVLTEVTEQDVALHDPSQPHGPNRCSLNHFLMAWKEFDDKAAVIRRN